PPHHPVLCGRRGRPGPALPPFPRPTGPGGVACLPIALAAAARLLEPLQPNGLRPPPVLPPDPGPPGTGRALTLRHAAADFARGAQSRGSPAVFGGGDARTGPRPLPDRLRLRPARR